MPEPLFSVPKIDPSTTDLGDVGQSLEGQGGFGGSSFAQAPAPAQKKRFDFARALAFAGGLGPNVIAAETARGQAQAKRQAAERASVIKTADAAIKDQIDIINGMTRDLDKKLITGSVTLDQLGRVFKNAEDASAFVANGAIRSYTAAGIPREVAQTKGQALGMALERLKLQMDFLQTPKGAGESEGQTERGKFGGLTGREPTGSEADRLAGVGPQSVIGKLQSDHAAAMESGNTQAAGQLQNRIAKLTAITAAERNGSDLLDANGVMKNEAIAEVRRQATALVSNSVNAFGQPVVTGEQAKIAQRITAGAAQIINKSKGTVGIAQAVEESAVKSGFEPPPTPEINVPLEKRRELATQNVEINKATLKMRGLFGKVGRATGLGSRGAAILDATVGQILEAFGGGTLFSKAQDARQDVKIFTQEFKRAFINNPKFPVAEQARLEQLLPNPDAWFANPATAIKNFKLLYDELQVIRHFNDQLISGKKPSLPEISDPNDPNFAKLPSGGMFMDGNGKLRRKK